MRFLSVISTIFLCFVTASICLAHQFNQYIKNYEIVQHQIVLHRSELNVVDKVWGYNEIYIPDVEVRFSSFKTHFHLQLTEDLNFLMLLDYSSEHSNVTTRFYEGVLKNTPGSLVIGYLYNNVFHGVIKNGSVTYYLEPAKYILQNFSEHKALIYGNNDTLPFKTHEIKETYKSKTSFLKNNLLNQTFSYFKQNKIIKLKKSFGISRRSSEENEIYLSKFNEQKDPTCQIEMIADHTLYEFYKKNEKIIEASLYLHVKHADSVFRTTDFDGDGHPDRIRLRVAKISVLKSINDPDYPMKHAKDIQEYLKLFFKRKNEQCVAFSISARPFPGTNFGLSEHGTLCSTFSPDSKEHTKTSSNIGTFTIVTNLGHPLSLGVTLGMMCHEMGHLFGASNDPEKDKRCWIGGKDGYFIMSNAWRDGTHPNNLKFSPCSIKQIGPTLKGNGKKCIKPMPAKCGNGIREGNEECDCGDSSICDYLDHCCTPKVTKHHSYIELKSHQDEACHIRKSKGYECSPAENRCCTKSCKKSKDKRCAVQYRSEILCSANGLSNCVCLQDPCLICCKVNNTCVSAKSLGFPGYAEAQEAANCTTLGNTPVNETSVDNGNSVTDWSLSLFIFSLLFLSLF